MTWHTALPVRPAVTGETAPSSVTIAVTSSGGVTSNAGLYAWVPSGATGSPPAASPSAPDLRRCELRHLSAGALLHLDRRPVRGLQIHRRGRRHHDERHMVVPGQHRQRIAADLVRHRSVRRDPVGPDQHRVHLPRGEQRTRRVVREQACTPSRCAPPRKRSAGRPAAADASRPPTAAAAAPPGAPPSATAKAVPSPPETSAPVLQWVRIRCPPPGSSSSSSASPCSRHRARWPRRPPGAAPAPRPAPPRPPAAVRALGQRRPVRRRRPAHPVAEVHRGRPGAAPAAPRPRPRRSPATAASATPYAPAMPSNGAPRTASVRIASHQRGHVRAHQLDLLARAAASGRGAPAPGPPGAPPNGWREAREARCPPAIARPDQPSAQSAR